MNPLLGWALAVVAIAVGYAGYGWPGVALGITVVVFWLLLQFNRVVRVMRNAGGRPVGTVGSAVMLHAKLRDGMRLIDVLPIAGSLGTKLADDPETFAWTDAAGDRVEVELERARLARWRLVRAAAGTAGEPPAAVTDT